MIFQMVSFLLNLVDRHDYFDIEIGCEGSTWMCSDSLTSQIGSDGNFSDIHNQFDTMISSERERAFLALCQL